MYNLFRNKVYRRRTISCHESYSSFIYKRVFLFNIWLNDVVLRAFFRINLKTELLYIFTHFYY